MTDNNNFTRLDYSKSIFSNRAKTGVPFNPMFEIVMAQRDIKQARKLEQIMKIKNGDKRKSKLMKFIHKAYERRFKKAVKKTSQVVNIEIDSELGVYL